ncbi:MAG TPA: hypothetical protein VGE74_24005 [Gemmata sp.]
MARHTEGAWFRAAKNTWYATLDGKSVSLKVKGEKNRKVAQEAWHRLMADGPKPKAEPKLEPKAEVTVKDVTDAFLQDAEGRVSPEAWRGYAKFLTPFARAHAKRLAESLTAQEAEAFAKRPSAKWSASYQAGFLDTLVMAYRCAVRENLIATSPVEDRAAALLKKWGMAWLPKIGRINSVGPPHRAPRHRLLNIIGTVVNVGFGFDIDYTFDRGFISTVRAEWPDEIDPDSAHPVGSGIHTMWHIEHVVDTLACQLIHRPTAPASVADSPAVSHTAGDSVPS